MADDRIPVKNEELVTPRDFRREFPKRLAELQAEELDKLVLMKGADMVAVVLTVERYAELLNGGGE